MSLIENNFNFINISSFDWSSVLGFVKTHPILFLILLKVVVVSFIIRYVKKWRRAKAEASALNVPQDDFGIE